MASFTTIYSPVATMTIDYLTSNLRITNVTWVLLVSGSVHTKIWLDNILRVDRIDTTDGSEGIPGNLALEEYTDPDRPELGTMLRLPSNLSFMMTTE